MSDPTGSDPPQAPRHDEQSWGIEFEDVGLRIADVVILESVNGAIEPGRVTALIGPNGAGKTSLLLAILGQLPYTGSIRFREPAAGGPGANGRSRPIIGYVPQRLDLDRGVPITVSDFLVGGLQRRPLWAGRGAGVRGKVEAALDRIGAAGLAGKQLGALSGGELQRILLAQALLREPQILLLDEPSTAVDVGGEALFCDLLESIHRERKLTTVWVSHDLSIVTNHADEVICLNRTISCSGAPEAILTPDRLRELFGPHASVYGHHTGDHPGHHHHG